ncbi:hypothetical protein ACQPU1_09185 [Clostridium paraputrificum]|uniref:hypothetical protein n=1 Tax=Clostridium TaxID=1485 RepID=UPI003D3275EF
MIVGLYFKSIFGNMWARVENNTCEEIKDIEIILKDVPMGTSKIKKVLGKSKERIAINKRGMRKAGYLMVKFNDLQGNSYKRDFDEVILPDDYKDVSIEISKVNNEYVMNLKPGIND